jgi:diacylglycerol O-acyltransferase
MTTGTTEAGRPRTGRGRPVGAGRLERGRPALARALAGWWDVAAGLAVFGLYLLVAEVVDHRLGAATRNAIDVLDVERLLHVDVERAVNAWTARQPAWLSTFADYHYAIGYLATTFVAVLWLRIRRPSAYARHVLAFLGLNVAAITVFALYPVTPPRLLDGHGFVDTVEAHDTVGSWGTGLVSMIANQHAAMPSLHVAWAVWVAYALLTEHAPRWLARSGVLHVGTTTAVIVMTGNHWVLDAVAGAALAMLAVPGILRLSAPR